MIDKNYEFVCFVVYLFGSMFTAYSMHVANRKFNEKHMFRTMCRSATAPKANNNCIDHREAKKNAI